MNRQTEQTLGRINRRFYDDHAQEFAITRHAPWGGWDGLLEPLGFRHAGPIRVLDAGCGNGRFGAFLADRWPSRVRYTGIDASAMLLEIAGARLQSRVDLKLIRRDLLEEPLTKPDAGPGFDLAACFGVLHHMPGRARRRELLESLAAQLAPGGFLAFSIWLFGRDPRFRRRLAPWSSLPPDLGEVKEEELEPGDHLLLWGDPPGALRYCHAVSDEEEGEWVHGLGLRCAARYEADGKSGRLNRYLLLRRV